MSASSVSVRFLVPGSSSNPPSSSNDNFSFSTIHFPSKSTHKPIKFPNFKPHHRLVKSLFSRALFFCAAAGFDGFEPTISTELLEEEDEEEELETESLDDEEYEEDEDEDTEEENEPSVSKSPEARRLYVGNLPFTITSPQLAGIFSQCGRVASAEIVCDRVTDRSRGFAFVTMGTYEEAKEAVRLFDESLVGGRTVKVNFPEVPRGGEREVMEPKIRSGYKSFEDSPHKIYAGNLFWGLTSQGLREAFQDQPGFLSAKVVYDRGTGRSRGFGFITFSSALDAEYALDAMNGVELEGRPLRMNLAVQRSPPSPPPAAASDSEDAESNQIISGFGV